jgi:glycosyltransferase involved in cell wall biosynthesis
MRIAIVSEHASPLAVLGGTDAGGQNAHVAALARGLAARGHEVTVYTRRDDPHLPRRLSLGGTPDGRAGNEPGSVVIDHIDAGPAEHVSKDAMFGYMDEFAAELRKRWAERPPDVVHSHFWMSGYAAVRAARPLGIGVLHTFHALGVVKRREQGVADTSPPERAEIEPGLLHQADRILATCPDEVFELLRLGGDRKKIAVVPCGVDTGLFTPDGPAAPRGPAEARPHRILYVGRLVERKGIGNLITALPEVPGPELLIAGGPAPGEMDGDPDIERLRRLARKHRVAGRVRFLGRVEHSELPALYRSADVVACVPWYEPFGIVPVEAMACGVPVVVAAVGGLADTVIDNGTGLHVPPRRPDLIAAALRQLLDDPERCAALGAAGRQRAARHYAMDRMIAGTLRAYTATARTIQRTGGMRA